MADTQIAKSKTKNKKSYLIYIKVIVWFALLYASTYVNLHAIFVIVTGVFLVFTNLGKRKAGDVSAYSVFNKNFQKPAGSMDADEMLFGKSKNRQRGKIFGEEQQKLAQKVDQYYRNESKYGNKPCYCESGLKFKKCCLLTKRNQSSKGANKEI